MNMRKWYVLIVLMYVPALYSAADIGAHDVTTGLGTGHYEDMQKIFYADVLSYTSGGVTFTYPVGLFTQKPHIRVTLALKNRAYQTYKMSGYEVVSTSSASTTIRVNVGSGAAYPPIVETATNDVDVYFEAWQLEETIPL